MEFHLCGAGHLRWKQSFGAGSKEGWRHSLWSLMKFEPQFCGAKVPVLFTGCSWRALWCVGVHPLAPSPADARGWNVEILRTYDGGDLARWVVGVRKVLKPPDWWEHNCLGSLLVLLGEESPALQTPWGLSEGLTPGQEQPPCLPAAALPEAGSRQKAEP